jgi:CPA2 family monovalent cation:H+ antiporter-2
MDIEIARKANPGIDIAVRTHNETERRKLLARAPGLVLMGEQELAFGMMQYALRGQGIAGADIAAFVAASRADMPPPPSVTRVPPADRPR